ncbi:MAG TPA: SDR family NAD(P)-dependent oxidoreductase [Novosphingobium sp.]|nr:SDR family NAD(P)-dependent oxidoreductase [Novosphingobium sp.]
MAASTQPATAVGDFTGRTVLVTGASSGVGKMVTTTLAERGAKVIACGRKEEKLLPLAEIPGVQILAFDLGNMEALDAALEKLATMTDTLHGIVNNAAVTGRSPFDTLPMREWQRILDVNLTGPFRLSQGALPLLRRAAGHASIVNVASAQALVPTTAGAPGYTAAKAGLIGLTKTMAAALAPDIRVNVVCPGLVDTETGRLSLGGADLSTAASRYAMGRVATSMEIVECILFLLSDASSIVTGATLATDGGRSYH